jgi:hypothetical protein
MVSLSVQKLEGIMLGQDSERRFHR